jgi:hypothetical protein
MTMLAKSPDTSSRNSDAIKTVFREKLSSEHISEALGMIKSGSYISADVANSIFTNVLDGLLEKNIPAAVKLLDAAMKDPSFGLLQLKPFYVEQSKQKAVDRVRSVLDDGFMTEEIIKSEFGAEAPLCIKDRLKTIFLESIGNFVKKGWVPEAKESVGIAVRYLGMPSGEIEAKINDVKEGLKNNEWEVKDADELLAFLVKITKGSAPESKGPMTNQPRLM